MDPDQVNTAMDAAMWLGFFWWTLIIGIGGYMLGARARKTETSPPPDEYVPQHSALTTPNLADELLD